jgi:hypothetical protein
MLDHGCRTCNVRFCRCLWFDAGSAKQNEVCPILLCRRIETEATDIFSCPDGLERDVSEQNGTGAVFENGLKTERNVVGQTFTQSTVENIKS